MTDTESSKGTPLYCSLLKEILFGINIGWLGGAYRTDSNDLLTTRLGLVRVESCICFNLVNKLYKV